MNPKLQDKWARLWKSLGAQGDGQSEFIDLVLLYSEGHRAYHTMAHIEHCLAEFDEARAIIGAPDVVEAALWYHDAIYNPRANNNEEESALLATAALTRADLSTGFVVLVQCCILATRHDVAPTSAEGMIVVDIDLAILGQSKERFDEYEWQIRLEYNWVPEEAFRKGRAAILQQFLARPTIYHTPHFQAKYEGQARENLARSLEQLQALS